VASCLESGPALDNPFGFHILVYPDCIEFSMEFCDHRLFDENELLFALKKLHAIGIMHCDIKPSNVSYSHVYKCPVFIDFGLSILVG
jgi:serine/threonine protein kinase